jgi:hypothetical protein
MEALASATDTLAVVCLIPVLKGWWLLYLRCPDRAYDVKRATRQLQEVDNRQECGECGYDYVFSYFVHTFVGLFPHTLSAYYSQARSPGLVAKVARESVALG